MQLMIHLNHLILGNLEKFFFWWGRKVTQHPSIVILSCFVLTGAAATGLLRFRQESRANQLWMPSDSEYNTNKKWLDEHFKTKERSSIILFKADNVLTPKALDKMLELYINVLNITVEDNTFEDICTRISIADIFQTKKRRKRQIFEEDYQTATNSTADEYDIWTGDYDEYDDTEPVKFDTRTRINFKKYGHQNVENDVTDTISEITDNLPPNVYCDLVTTLNSKCLVKNLLEIWRYNPEYIKTTTTEEILLAINTLQKSPWYGYNTNYTSLLGGVTRNSSGHVVSAKTALMFWSITVPDDVEIDVNQGNGEIVVLADATTLAWEKMFIEIALNMTGEAMEIFPNAVRSFGDISGEALQSDFSLIFGGFILMLSYTVLMLGRINMVEIRILLTVIGLVSILMGIIIGMGLSLAMGFAYTTVHPVLPLLCLGIGIDDMFVIMQSLYNVKKYKKLKNISSSEEVAHALKYAGVSITVTSITDIFVFALGAFSTMPGLQSFCVTVAIALGSIFLLQVSFFVAWLSFDEKRIAMSKNAVIFCYVHENLTSTQLTNRFYDKVQEIYLFWVNSILYKIVVVLIAATLVGFGIYGWIEIKQVLDLKLLLPSDSYLRKWYKIQKEYYPNNGHMAEAYSGPLEYSDLEKIDKLVHGLQELEQKQIYLSKVESWWTEMKKYIEEETNFTTWKDIECERDFKMALSDFLFSSLGAKFRSNFKFDGELHCSKPAPPITASKFKFSYFSLETPEKHIPARIAVNKIMQDSPYNFSDSLVYPAWETDRIIGSELWRNLGLSIAAVVLVTLLLLCNIHVCVYVVLMVTMSLINIIGFLHFWNVAIDTISCIGIVLSVGLCVDYSVHIGHAYLIASGTKQERSNEAVLSIGPAVFNGGFSTFLAMVLTSIGSGYISVTFFKILALTTIFGLFHGLVLLPVILSIMGPTNYSLPQTTEESKNVELEPRERNH